MKKLLRVFGVALAFVLVLAGCGNDEETAGEGSEVIQVGIVGSDSAVWDHVADKAAEEGIEIDLVFFDSYPLPNAALDAGEIDLNAFQHHIYLETEIEQFGYAIDVLAETYVAPLGIYSSQLDAVQDVEDGARIVIPDDVTNGGRALLLLQEEGLIEVDPEAGYTPTLQDVENPRGFDIVELAAANIPASLEEAPLAVINSGIASDAGYVPSEAALVLEEVTPGENPYINVIAARTDELEDETLNRIVELYQTEDTKEVIDEDSKGSYIPVF